MKNVLRIVIAVSFLMVGLPANAETDQDNYVIGLLGTGFSSVDGETNYGSIHSRSSEQLVELGDDEDTRTLILGHNTTGFFDAYEFGITTGDSGFRSSSDYVADLGVNSRSRSTEAFVQASKSLYTTDRFTAQALVGVGYRALDVEVDEVVRGGPSNTNSYTHTTPTVRAGLGLSYDLTDQVSVVARGMWSEELRDQGTVIAHDREWCELNLDTDDNGFEAAIGIQVGF